MGILDCVMDTRNNFLAFLADDRGVALPEYAMVLAMLTVAGFVIFGGVVTSTGGITTHQTATINSAVLAE